MNREADLLLATTIIESGLDVPNANTIFIDRPDMYGLAELHQLRGRVGRHRVKARAYLLMRPEAIPTGDGEKRLRAIEELNELGSGFRIAMRDLEIRGAGNILGHQQHGHIVAVGYELYCRLLEKAAKNLKSERMLLPEEVDINLDFEVWLPDSYISSSTVKLELYRKLGRARKRDDFRALQSELIDRFGPVPERVLWLLDVSRIRALCEHVEVQSVAQSEGLGLLLRPESKKPVLRRLISTGAEHRLFGEKDILLVYKGTFESPEQVLHVLRSALLP
jgi:transcription-repair coupling factor (superfamily II helicase)